MTLKKTLKTQKKLFLKENSFITKKREKPGFLKRFDRRLGKIARKVDKGRRSFARSNTFKFADNFSKGVADVLAGDDYR